MNNCHRNFAVADSVLNDTWRGCHGYTSSWSVTFAILRSTSPPLSKLQSSPTFRWLFLAIPCTLTGVSTPEVLLSQIPFRGVWLELPALAMSRTWGFLAGTVQMRTSVSTESSSSGKQSVWWGANEP